MMATITAARSDRPAADGSLHLHQHPELSPGSAAPPPRGPNGSAGQGFEVHQCIGVVSVLHNGDGTAVLLRMDMDALPVRERTGLPNPARVTACPAPLRR
jgi:metal-dependent amidase/aminoacylase/carboxypeptidase family protein